MKLYLPLLAVVSGLSSCYHVYYAPNTAHVPLLEKKGEVRINALYASGGDSKYEGGELQTAYAVGNNIAVMVNGSSVNRTEQVSDFYGNNTHTEKGRGSYIEAAAGYFTKLKGSGKWIFEVYGGTGYGGVKSDYGYKDWSELSFKKYFVKPAIGFKTPGFELAFAPGLNIVRWKIKEEKNASQENTDVQGDLQFIRSRLSFFAFEPALMFRAGHENIKVQAGLTLSRSPDDMFINDLIESVNFNIGISLNIKPSRK